MNEQNVIAHRPRWGVWIWWVLASAIGSTAGVVLYFLAIPLWFHREGDFAFVGPSGGLVALFWVQLGILMGLPVALAQALVLRRYNMNWHSWAWLLINMVGAGVGTGAFFAVQHALLHNNYSFILTNRHYIEGSLILAGTGGLILGFGQWLVIRRGTNKSAWWVPFCAVGWGASWLITSILANAWPIPIVSPPFSDSDAGGDVLIRWVVLLLMHVVMFSAILGARLLWMARVHLNRRMSTGETVPS